MSKWLYSCVLGKMIKNITEVRTVHGVAFCFSISASLSLLRASIHACTHTYNAKKRPVMKVNQQNYSFDWDHHRFEEVSVFQDCFLICKWFFFFKFRKYFAIISLAIFVVIIKSTRLRSITDLDKIIHLSWKLNSSSLSFPSCALISFKRLSSASLF